MERSPICGVSPTSATTPSYVLSEEGYLRLQSAVLTFRYLQTSPNHENYRAFFGTCSEVVEQVLSEIRRITPDRAMQEGRDFPTLQCQGSLHEGKQKAPSY